MFYFGVEFMEHVLNISQLLKYYCDDYVKRNSPSDVDVRVLA